MLCDAVFLLQIKGFILPFVNGSQEKPPQTVRDFQVSESWLIDGLYQTVRLQTLSSYALDRSIRPKLLSQPGGVFSYWFTECVTGCFFYSHNLTEKWGITGQVELIPFWIFGREEKLPICSQTNVPTNSRIERSTGRPFWLFVGRCFC